MYVYTKNKILTVSTKITFLFYSCISLHSNKVWPFYPILYLVYPEEFIRSEKGIRCTKRNLNVLKEFPAHSESVNSAFEAINVCETYCSKEKNMLGM